MNPSPIPAIVALHRSGDFAEAERHCRDALARDSDNADLAFLLALSLHLQQRLAEALPLYARLTQTQPHSPVHWGNYATALAETGQPDAAQAAWRRVAALDPHDAHARMRIGLLLLEAKQYLAAREALLDAFELARDTPEIRIHAARACALAQDFRGAEDLLKPWRQWLPLHDDALQLELARQLMPLGRTPDTHFLLEDLVARNAANIAALIQLARVEERLNHLDAAERVLARLDETAASEAERKDVVQLRATLLLRRGDAAGARALLEHGGPTSEHDYSHYFELARACDKLRDAPAAMRALAQAHALQARELAHASPECFIAGAAALPGAIRYVGADQHATWPQLHAPDSGDSPIFVVGFPRSGTTLLEQMLDAHPRLQSMDENPFFERLASKLRAHDERILDDLSVLRQYDCDELRKHYWRMVGERVQRRPESRIVDKNPLNLLWLPFMYRLFPAAKFVFCLRHPCDVMLSCYMQNFRSVILAAACENLPRLAHAYVQAMQCWRQHVDVFQPQVLVSRYEDLVGDFTTQTGRIADFLELDDATPMLAFDRHAREKGFIATPSYSQVIEPVNTRAMNRWHRYRHYFEPVLPTLATLLERFGYDA